MTMPIEMISLVFTCLTNRNLNAQGNQQNKKEINAQFILKATRLKNNFKTIDVQYDKESSKF